MRGPGHDEEHEFEQADDQRCSLDPLVGPAGHDDEQRRRGEGQGEAAGQAEQFADAGDAGELGDQGAYDGASQPQSRKPRPAKAEPHPDQFAIAAAGVNAEPHGQFLDHVQHRDQQQHQRQQAIAPLRAALGGGDDVARVSVGQHDQEARSPDRNRAEKRDGAEGVRLRLGLHRPGSPLKVAGRSTEEPAPRARTTPRSNRATHWSARLAGVRDYRKGEKKVNRPRRAPRAPRALGTKAASRRRATRRDHAPRPPGLEAPPESASGMAALILAHADRQAALRLPSESGTNNQEGRFSLRPSRPRGERKGWRNEPCRGSPTSSRRRGASPSPRAIERASTDPRTNPGPTPVSRRQR